MKPIWDRPEDWGKELVDRQARLTASEWQLGALFIAVAALFVILLFTKG